MLSRLLGSRQCQAPHHVRRRSPTRPCLLLLVLIATACTSTPSTPPLLHFQDQWERYRTVREAMAPAMRRLIDRGRIVGLSIALVADGRVVWAEGFGHADRQRGRAAGADTVYRAGSIAKLFTATAIMQLADRGALDLDAPLERYLPRFTIGSRFGSAAGITPRRLLTHHAGLPCDLHRGMWSESDFREVAERLQEVQAASPPGQIFSYSNIGYTLLGHLAEELSGMAFPALVEERLLAPLGMRRTAFAATPPAELQLAVGYRNGEPLTPPPIRDIPAMGIYTTALDLARFMQMVLGGGSLDGRRLLGAESLAAMLRPQNADFPLDLGNPIGLGWSLDAGSLEGLGPVARHGGTTPLFAAELVMLSRHGLGVVILANTADSRNLLRQLAEKTLQLAAAAQGVPAAEPDAPPRLVRGERLPPQAAGEYATDFGLVTLVPERSELCACSLGQKLALIPYFDGGFGVGAGDAGLYRKLKHLRFSHERLQGREVLVAHNGGRRFVFGERVTLPTDNAQWRRRAGRYRILNANPGYSMQEVHIRSGEGRLHLEYRLPVAPQTLIRKPLAPLSDDLAVTLGPGRGGGEAVQVRRSGTREELLFSGYRLTREGE